MRLNKNQLITSVICLLLVSCATTKQLPLIFDEVVVKNTGNQDLSELEIKVSDVNRYFSCSVVLAKSYCANAFSKRYYQENTLSLSWTKNNVQFNLQNIKIPAPQQYQGSPYRVVLMIDDSNQYNIAFELK